MKKIKKLILAIFLEFSKFLNLIITNWPDGRIGNKVRSIYWKYILNKINFILQSYIYIQQEKVNK